MFNKAYIGCTKCPWFRPAKKRNKTGQGRYGKTFNPKCDGYQFCVEEAEAEGLKSVLSQGRNNGH